MLEIKNLNLKYGRIQVIWDLTMSIYNNEAVGIFGPNGAGKTTLISSIIGLIKPEKGDLIFEGNSLIGFKTHEIIRKGISLVPQERELFPFMTVEENLKLGAAYVPNARNRISENLDFVFEIFPILKERIHQLAGTMSGGQQRMLAIGRALMANPKLLILDEPSLGLQPSLVIELFQKLVEIKKAGVSIMLAEQNVKQGLKVIDRGYVLENGKIVMEDDAQDLANNSHIQKSYLGV
ncbi:MULTISPECIES: ABC transporter ATP-binding protein [Petrotoga]|uniref:Amino acid/amide ABC transporter ATP-binding protein 2 (HAAT family) n=2 Tax=Petrotoga sibirica TaxID=156202 RepID=A0A4R8EJG3_9BACT|nr:MULTISPECIES: ABC transporter ATP-binding protein [Petrotoga]POZ88992.1 leucine/isoleucine/valine transporter ATP-binding subunit [Petrotoga sibirica DSM 13575]POZ91401.1 leucine/isoleucine/valine transporter ATP-binding subunit [Petrotoga sp. SL27]TDX10097.1 amino acid/amide ABC transporter ATP-binding protein 2 (HAAT family) [Petrotoga sibirica]